MPELSVGLDVPSGAAWIRKALFISVISPSTGDEPVLVVLAAVLCESLGLFDLMPDPFTTRGRPRLFGFALN